VVDAQKMSDSEDHAERVPIPSSNHLRTHAKCTQSDWGAGGQAYRELHGMLGEGKDQFREGLSVVLFLINAADPGHVKNTLARLKVLQPPTHARFFGSFRSKSYSYLARLIDWLIYCPVGAGSGVHCAYALVPLLRWARHLHCRSSRTYFSPLPM
jgi:hypothetical protein